MEIVVTSEKSLTDEIAQVLQAHWLFCTSSTPIEHVYALDAAKLFSPDITVFGARIDGALVGVGAMRKLDPLHAELKSMHTLANFRGLGVGKAMVAHIEDFARGVGVERMSLETGTNDAFGAARKLYQSLGYKSCDAFGDYVLSEDNICMTKLI